MVIDIRSFVVFGERVRKGRKFLYWCGLYGCMYLFKLISYILDVYVVLFELYFNLKKE